MRHTTANLPLGEYRSRDLENPNGMEVWGKDKDKTTRKPQDLIDNPSPDRKTSE